uniref:Uncharacterized protein n=1 Tax=Arundo donax TaxID=35708 RepID=A0A0A9CZH1_ARUDO
MFTEELDLHTKKQPLHNELKYSYVYMVLLAISGKSSKFRLHLQTLEFRVQSMISTLGGAISSLISME